MRITDLQPGVKKKDTSEAIMLMYTFVIQIKAISKLQFQEYADKNAL